MLEKVLKNAGGRLLPGCGCVQQITGERGSFALSPYRGSHALCRAYPALCGSAAEHGRLRSTFAPSGRGAGALRYACVSIEAPVRVRLTLLAQASARRTRAIQPAGKKCDEMTILGAPYTGVPPTGEFVLPPYLSGKGGGEDEDSDDAEVPHNRCSFAASACSTHPHTAW